ncbi:SPOR domain-containing protein [Aegicerativicinus sediminis]|uniref:SPOR domain-containing protein n=1 Tax=Aegicerativicinus sediminis TaxID=2893202 RepID=UPI001E5F47B5|nr:SPOR domain-containing protein [Aegicerativicinus sediminis]
MKKLSLIIAIFMFSIAGSYSSFAQNATVTVEQDKAIAKLLEYKKDIETANIYRIQIFSGDRSGAEKSRSEFQSSYGQFPSNITFETPNYKIWVGNFRTRLEADRALLDIKKKFPSAFIFRPKKNR